MYNLLLTLVKLYICFAEYSKQYEETYLF